MSAPSDEAIKTRIVAHMNKDHADSLSRYLEVYSGLSYYSVQSPELKDLNLKSMVIAADGCAYFVPFNPPLSSYAESRTRLISMHEECGRKLGRDSIIVKNFRYPGIVHGAILFGVLLGLVVFANGNNFAPGSFLATTLFKPVPQLASFAQKNHWTIWWAILLIHVAEAGIMTTQMKKYNVSPFSKVWWLYVGFTAVEGYGCTARLKAEVRKERALKAAKDEKSSSH